jgi:hypothetical protein
MSGVHARRTVEATAATVNREAFVLELELGYESRPGP